MSDPCVTRVSRLVIASVSNWGGYGLVAALSSLVGRDLLPTVDDERRLVERTAALGAVDGTTGEADGKVDGFDPEVTAEILTDLHALAREAHDPFDELRARHPRFTYEDYAVERVGDDLRSPSASRWRPTSSFAPTTTLRASTPPGSPRCRGSARRPRVPPRDHRAPQLLEDGVRAGDRHQGRRARRGAGGVVARPDPPRDARVLLRQRHRLPARRPLHARDLAARRPAGGALRGSAAGRRGPRARERRQGLRVHARVPA